jgi:hypothetical protein
MGKKIPIKDQVFRVSSPDEWENYDEEEKFKEEIQPMVFALVEKAEKLGVPLIVAAYPKRILDDGIMTHVTTSMADPARGSDEFYNTYFKASNQEEQESKANEWKVYQ